MSPKRPYRLGKRAAAVAATRRRILAAALTEFTEHGIEHTSMQAIARRAEVATGTVFYHWPDPDALAADLVENLLREIRIPDPAVVDPDDPLPRRVAALVSALFDFLAESDHLYPFYARNQEHPVVAEGNARFQAVLEQMVGDALGPWAADPERAGPVLTLLDPWFRGTLLERGVTDPATVVTELVMCLLGPESDATNDH